MITPTYEKEYALRASDFDCYERLRPCAVLELFQDAAGDHGELLGVGFEAMLKRGLLWVLVRIRYQVLRQPDYAQTVCMKTWPLPPAGVSFQREYRIESTDGDLLIVGSSEWVFMDVNTRRLAAARDAYPLSDGEFCTDRVFEGRMKKLREFEPQGEPYCVIPAFSDLDRNLHVNNTRYANYVMDAVCPAQQEEIKVFQIDYRHEVQRGMQLQLVSLRTDGEIQSAGKYEQDETMFLCKLEF